MLEGTSLIRFRQAFIDRLTTDAPNVAYQSPMNPADMLGEDGSGVACWWSDEVEGVGSVEVMVGGGEVWFDENYTTTLRIQGLGLDTDDTQAVCDQRANELLGAAIRLLCLPDEVDLTDDDIQTFSYTLGGWRWSGGVLGTANRAAGFELDINVYARLKLGSAS